jgi:hypothetical protein
LAKDNREHEDVIVAFNGKDHKLKEWTRKEKAATDDDPSLNWRKVFEEHTPKTNMGEPAPTGFVPYKKVKKKRRKTSTAPIILLFKQFWIPFLSAVIVGLGIGFTVLIMFSHHKTEDKQAVPTTAQPAKQTPSDEVAKSMGGDGFAINLQVIQGGSFDTLKAAKDRLTELKDQSVPAAIFTEDNNYKVMIGVAKSEDARRKMQEKLGDIELYGKSWSFHPQTIKTSKNVGDFLKTGKDFVESMVPLSVSKESDKTLDKKVLSKISDEMGNWSGIDDLNVKGSLKSDLTSFRGAVEAALSHLENGDDPDDGQQSLLDAISIYQKILLALSE